MSTIQEITSNNYLFEDSKEFDSNWFRGINLNAEVTKANKIASSFVMAVAEAVNYVAQAALLRVSCDYFGKQLVFTYIGILGLMKLLDLKPYTKEDIEKFDNRKSYVQYFEAKAELVACLSAKNQAYWLAKECIKSTIHRIIAAAIILKGAPLGLFPRNHVVVFFVVDNFLRAYAACTSINIHTTNVLNYFEAKTNSFIYHLVQNQQPDLA